MTGHEKNVTAYTIGTKTKRKIHLSALLNAAKKKALISLGIFFTTIAPQDSKVVNALKRLHTITQPA